MKQILFLLTLLGVLSASTGCDTKKADEKTNPDFVTPDFKKAEGGRSAMQKSTPK
jgi:hypothetical protein